MKPVFKPAEGLGRPARVLVVEDEPRLRDLLLRAVPDMGFEVAAVTHGTEAMNVFSQRPPDIVLLDLNLPDMDGLELFERVHDQWPNTRFIILTGFGTVEAAQQAIRLDVVDFLTKPASLGEIDRALNRARQEWMADMGYPAAATPLTPPLRPETLQDVERTTILQVLERNNGNRAATARELGISVRKLYYRLAEYQRQGYLT